MRPGRLFAPPTRLGRLAIACWLWASCAARPGTTTDPAGWTRRPGLQIKFCTATVTEHDVHRCLAELSPEQQRRAAFSYRLAFDGARLVAFDTINGRGQFTEEPTTPSSDEFVYDGGRVVDVIRRDRNGVVRGHTQISPDGAQVRWVDTAGRPAVKKGTRAGGLRRVLNAAGRVTSYSYVAADGSPTLSTGGIFEVRPVRDEQGVLLEESYFNDTGAPAADKDGIHRIVYTRDALGLAVTESYFDDDGRPAMRTDGVHQVRWQRDDVGNILAAAFTDLAGLPHRSSEEGACGYQVARDAFGTEISRTYVDEANRPTVSAFGYATRKKVLDRDGLPVEWTFFGVDGHPMLLHNREHAALRRTLDARKRTVLEIFLDVDGQPRLMPGGYRRMETAYDGRDNAITITLQDEAGRPSNGRAGHAVRRQTFDGDRLVRQQFFDAAGKVTDSSGSYAEIVTAYDLVGEPKETFFDALGREQAPPPANAARAVASVSCLSRPAAGGRPAGKEPDTQPKEKDALQQALAKGSTTLQACYQARLLQKPYPTGRIVTRFSISPAGQVSTSCVEASTVGDPVLDRCVVDEILKWQFPRSPTGKWTAVSYPVSFEIPDWN